MKSVFEDSSAGQLLRRAAPIVGTLLLVAVVVPFVLFAVPQVIGADHGFVILSGSMEPAISPGDVVIVDGSAAVAVGDVITYRDGEISTTHRVVGVEDGQYVTQGDANGGPDAALVPPELVIGTVTLTIPLIGHVILWANSPVGYVSLVAIPLGLLVGSELLAWARRGPPAEDQGTDAETRTDNPPPTDSAEMVTVATADLKLTLLATAGLLAYAAWSVYGEVTTVGAPDPISVAAGTAGLLGLLFAGWVTATAWSRGRLAGDAPIEAVAETDGGTSREEEQ